MATVLINSATSAEEDNWTYTVYASGEQGSSIEDTHYTIGDGETLIIADPDDYPITIEDGETLIIVGPDDDPITIEDGETLVFLNSNDSPANTEQDTWTYYAGDQGQIIVEDARYTIMNGDITGTILSSDGDHALYAISGDNWSFADATNHRIFPITDLASEYVHISIEEDDDGSWAAVDERDDSGHTTWAGDGYDLVFIGDWLPTLPSFPDSIQDNNLDINWVGTEGTNDLLVLDMSSYDQSLEGAVLTLTNKEDSDDINHFINFSTLNHSAIEYDHDTQALASLYDDIFDRQADLDGLQFYYDEIQDGDSLGDIVLTFLHSSEYAKNIDHVPFNNLSTENQIHELYDALLNRDADQGGFDYWLGEANNGTSMSEIAASFVASDEYVETFKAVDEWAFTV